MADETQSTGTAAPAAANNADISQEDLALLTGDDGKAQATPETKTDPKGTAKVAPTKTEVAQAVEKARHKYKLKVDGKEEDVDLSEEDIIRELQLAKKARVEIQTSSQLKKELGIFLEALKTNPRSVLSDPAIGVDLKQFAQQIINEQIEEELKSPEQREKEALQAELEQLRNKNKMDEEVRKTNEYNAMVQKYENDLTEQVQEALETSGLPKSPYILKRVSDVMLSALENNKDISPKQALSIVRKEMHSDLKDMFGASPEDLIEELIGSDTIKRLNKKQLAKIRTNIPSASQIKDTGSIKAKDRDNSPKEVKKIKIGDWLKGKT